MNDEYAKTVVLRDGPLGQTLAEDTQPATASPLPPAASTTMDDAPQHDYPAFEDTSWLT